MYSQTGAGKPNSINSKEKNVPTPRQSPSDIAETVCFSSFKKGNVEVICQFDSGKLILFREYGGGILTVLGFYYFMMNSPSFIQQKIYSIYSNPEALIEFNTQAPTLKTFSSLLHSYTLRQLSLIVLSKIDGPEPLIELLNQYPVTIFILEVFCRQVTSYEIQQNTSRYNHLLEELNFGAENGEFVSDLLADYERDPRGDYLNLIFHCMEMQGQVVYPNQCREKVGKKGKRITISFSQDRTTSESMIALPPGSKQSQPNQMPNNQKIPFSQGVHSNVTDTSDHLHTNNLMRGRLSRQEEVANEKTQNVKKSVYVSNVVKTKCPNCHLNKAVCRCSSATENLKKSNLKSPKSTAPNQSSRGRNVPQRSLNDREEPDKLNARNLGQKSNKNSILQIGGVNSHIKCTCYKVFCTCKR